MSIDKLKSVYYEFLSYFIPKRQHYEITGSCRKCGECCRQIRAKGMKNDKDLKFMQFIFPWYKNFYIIKTDERGEIVLSCKKLGNDGKCSIYKKRPLLCRNYPERYLNYNAEMIDGCGFHIIKKEFKDYL